MRWRARAIGCSAALLVPACAALAGLEPIAEHTPVESKESDARTQTGADASVPDVREADRTDAPSCKKDGEKGCQKAADCCSGQCREDGTCVTACQMPPPAEGTCPLDGDPDCCIGFWCGGGSLAIPRCAPCITAGNDVARDLFGNRNPRSCCSKKARDGVCQ